MTKIALLITAFGIVCTVEPALERPPQWPQKCGMSKQVVSGDRFSFTAMYFLLPRQVVCHGSGLKTGFTLSGITVKPLSEDHYMEEVVLIGLYMV